MFSAFRQFCERVLRIPPEPAPPPGDERRTQVFRAAHNYYKYLLIFWALTHGFVLLFHVAVLVIILVVASHFKTAYRDLLLWLIIFLGFVVFELVLNLVELVLLRLNYEKRWYVVTDRSLRVREGVFIVREATITFANIQNISISQGPIQRLLGIADLRVDTAGGGSRRNTHHGKFPSRNLHVAWFRGVSNAGEIRELMQQRLRHLKDAGLGDHDDHAAHSTVGISSSFLAALREVRAEAVALRQAVGQGEESAG